MNVSSTSDSAPSEARKRGSGGGSPRKLDDLLTGPSDLKVPAVGNVRWGMGGMFLTERGI